MNGTTRNPAVAGLFYPEQPDALAAAVRSYVQPDAEISTRPKALIAPHAGYIYSGACAGLAYAQLKPFAATYQRVVLLGPAHRYPVRGVCLPEADRLTTPLGSIAVDQALRARLAQQPQVSVDDAPAAQEHSLEVHLPFLQVVLGEFTLLPVLVGQIEPQQLSALLDMVWGDSHTLLVFSSDLSHFHDYAVARRLDADTCQRLVSLKEFLAPEQACGCNPLNGLIALAEHRHLQVRLLEQCNSGDTAGPRDRVVGYGSFVVHET